MVKIDNDVPVPSGSGRGRPAHYGFGEMAVGDSILVKDRKPEMARSAAAHHKRNNSGWDYKTRATSQGVRIWRTA